MRIRIDCRTLAEKSLRTLLEHKSGFELVQGRQEGVLIHITDLDCGSVRTDEQIIDPDIPLLGLTWSQPSRVLLEAGLIDFDACRFEAVQKPLSLTVITKKITKGSHAWGPVFRERGMNLWRHGIALKVSGAPECGKQRLVREIVSLYPVMKKFLQNPESFWAVLPLQIGCGLYTGLVHEETEDGLEGKIAGVASIAADCISGDRDGEFGKKIIRKNLFVLRDWRERLDRYSIYLDTLYSESFDELTQHYIAAFCQNHESFVIALQGLVERIETGLREKVSWQALGEQALLTALNLTKLLEQRKKLTGRMNNGKCNSCDPC